MCIFALCIIIITECLQLMMEGHGTPNLPFPMSLPTSNVTTTTVSSAVNQTTSSTSSQPAIIEATAVEEITSSQQNGTLIKPY